MDKALDKLERRAAPYRYLVRDIPVEPSTICGFLGCSAELPEDETIQSLVEKFHQAPQFDSDLTRKQIWLQICERHQALGPPQKCIPDWPLETNFIQVADNLIEKLGNWLDAVFSDEMSLVSCAGWQPFVSSIMLCCEDALEFGSLERLAQFKIAPRVSCAG